MELAIQATDLVKTFKGGTRALDNLSFEVEAGTIFGLLGPNGAGKTTAVRVITTIIEPDSGQASVLGLDVVKQAADVRNIIGLAGQNAAVDENLTGLENLRMVADLNHLPRSAVKARAIELIEQFDLVEAGGRPLKTYSGGMRRRLDVAAALVARPPVLFLDEPTTGLDPQSRNDLWAVIEGLVSEGTSVLLTTQYLEEADRLAKRVAVVDHGKIIANGTPAVLKASLGTTVLEIGLDSPIEAERASIALKAVGNSPPTILGNLIEIPVNDGPAVAMEVLRILDAEEFKPTAFTLREPSLDDVFLSLTGNTTTSEDSEQSR